MPDRYGEPPEPDTESGRYRAALDAERAIAACQICDDDGYRSGHVCDHTDHAQAARRGRALVWAAMGWADR